MPMYQFEALDQKGREIKDLIEAPSEEEAQARIRQMGYYVRKMSTKGRSRLRFGRRPAAGPMARRRKKSITIGKVKSKELTTFTRQLSTLQDAGLPILRSLRILEGQAKAGVLKNSLIDVIDEIESGSTLSEAMGKCPKCFDRLYVNMVKAGEAGGALEVILRRLAEFKEKARTLKRKIITAMVYPAMVITVAVGILVAILTFIIPQFKDIFAEFEIELPKITQMLLDASDFLVMPSLGWIPGVPNAVLIPTIPILWYIFIKLIKLNRTGRFVVDWAKLRIPIFGKIIHKTIVARTSRTLGTMIASGVPILESLIIARDTAGNAVFERAFQRIYDSVREGESMSQPLKESRVVDDIVVNMVDVGEETGALDNMLYKVADNYDEEVAMMVEGLVSLLEPVMIVVLGGIIGFIVIALFYPLIHIISQLGQSRQ